MTRIFISHSHADEAIAALLIDFLGEAIEISKKDIRCTSDPNHGLDFSSSSISDQLKNDLKNAGALIVIATIDSLRSPWILFEVGSFWTTDKLVAPIIGPGLTFDDLPGPLRGYRSIQIEKEDVSYQLNELINQLAKKLEIQQSGVTRIRDNKLNSFIDALGAWKPQLTATEQSQMQEVKRSKKQIQELELNIEELERSHKEQLEELEKALTLTQEEKEELEIDYQEKKRELEEALNLRMKQLEKGQEYIKELEEQERVLEGKIRELEKERSQNAQLQEKEKLKRSLEARIKQLEKELSQYEVVQQDLKSFSFGVLTVKNERGEEVNREKRQARYFTEELGNGVTLDMIAIPGGKFMMGTEEEEIERLVKKFGWSRFRREKPRHEVTIQPFLMGKYPVTQAQWKEIASLPKVNQDLEATPSQFKGENRPVEKVSWEDAVEFCQRLSQKTEKEYRLPSEAEWEYACRAGTTTPFYFGQTITDKLVNYNAGKLYASEPKGEYRKKTTSVGIFAPNSFGLYDMHGLVWEWCQDNYHNNYNNAPKDCSAWLLGNSISKVIRGGSWVDGPYGCRSACRSFYDRGDRSSFLGFRVVCVAPLQ